MLYYDNTTFNMYSIISINKRKFCEMTFIQIKNMNSKILIMHSYIKIAF